jgi:hypothetical protein
MSGTLLCGPYLSDFFVVALVALVILSSIFSGFVVAAVTVGVVCNPRRESRPSSIASVIDSADYG